MEYRSVAGTDLNVSSICFGMMYGSEARKDPGLKSGALQRALESGINCIHSCVEYGTWPVLAQVLDQWPDRQNLVHIIKMILPQDEDDNIFYPERFQRRVEDHLTALRTDRIDILQYQWRVAPGSDEKPLAVFERVVGAVVETFEKLRQQGKAGYLMVFPSVSCTAEVIATGHFSGMIGPCCLSRLDFGAFYTELGERNMALLGFSPLQGGSLTDRFAQYPSGHADDRRNSDKYVKEYEKRRRIEAFFGDAIGPSMTSFALRALLSTPVMGCLITGMSTAEQVDEILAAVEGPSLPADTFARAVELWHNELEPLERSS